MSITTCTCCGGRYYWTWEEAFDKFGFSDGDGMVMTATVAAALQDAGYVVERHVWGLHNEVIDSIKTKDGAELIPHGRIDHGYDDPREYLPQDIIAILDAAFPDGEEVWP